MRIIQITDIHIAKLGQDTIQNIDVWGKFQHVLAEAKTFNPDLLVISGDLCYQEGQVEIYRWVKTQLDKTGIDYLVIAGNHDDSVMMADVFGLPLNQETRESYYAKTYEVGQIIFLDTAKKGLSPKQWHWFGEQLALSSPTLIMMHHPPVLAQTEFMDTNHRFLQRTEFAEALSGKNKHFSVFCGHYHVERTILKADFNVFITPSSMAQIDGSKAEYSLDHLHPGYRIIDWDKESLNTQVRYLE